MASFTGVGDNVTLNTTLKGEEVSVAISGTYNMTILLQKEQGSPGSGSWATLNTYNTANATVADTYYSVDDTENLRLIVSVDTSGTATATLTNTTAEQTAVLRGRDGAVLYTGYQGASLVPVNKPVSLTASATITEAEHAGRVMLLNAAAGLTVTLPAATGTGNVYKFFVGTTVTSNTAVIQAASASDTMSGIALIDEAGGVTAGVWPTAADTDTITFDGSTTGGILGDLVELTDVATGKFHVLLTGSTTGTEATPFSAAVS